MFWSVDEFCDGFLKLMDHLELDRVRRGGKGRWRVRGKGGGGGGERERESTVIIFFFPC